MSAYSNQSILLNKEAQAVAINATNQVVSDINLISCDESRDMYLIAECSGVAGGAGVIKLQQCHRKDGVFLDVSGATVTVTADGIFVIEINERADADSALYPFVRLVSTTGGADTITIDRLYKTRRI